jgi:hypothetical protein
MKKLSKNYRFHGCNYHQIESGDNHTYIYLQTDSFGMEYYEVFIARIRNTEIIKGKLYPKREVYPKDEDWGFKAWTFPDKNSTYRKFQEIIGLANLS